MKSLFRIIFFGLFVYIILSGLIGLMQPSFSSTSDCEDQFLVMNTENDRYHQRDWSYGDNSRSFCTDYNTVEKESLASGKKRNGMLYEYDAYEDIWGGIYKNLVKESKSNIHFLVDSLSSVGIKKKLSRPDLAEMIVSFVQDIPYSYVIGTDCESYDTKGKPCLGNMSFGILSPYEFIHSLYGDCDTRAVLIYTLLEEMGFDPMIVVSNEYAHAMLALNIPAEGDHLKYRGNNYYFWETTAEGWPLGMLPPTTNNVNYWKVALARNIRE
ncbi:MAG: hypothetical protein AB8B73_14360 [Ekhidna sp.]